MEKLSKGTLEILNKYRGQPHIRGSIDCNLMVLELHEPDGYKQMLNAYSDIDGGVNMGKALAGAPSMRYYLKHNSNYSRVPSLSQKEGDIIVFPKGYNCYLSLGYFWLGVDDTEHFSLIPASNYDPESYLVFRKE